MKERDAQRTLADLAASQWGLVTTAQAVARGVTRVNLTRLTEAGDLERLSHGVYRDAGAPGDRFEDIRAAWLSTDPRRLAHERLGDGPDGVVVSGESAAWLHGIGDLPAPVHHFTAPKRRQTQRTEIAYRQRVLEEQDVTMAEGLPTITRERTIADLVEARVDLSLVADAFRDACLQSAPDLDRLKELLAPLAARNGFPKDDGAALLDRLTELAGLDAGSFADRVVRDPVLSQAVAASMLEKLAFFDVTVTGAFAEQMQSLSKQLFPTDMIEKQRAALTGFAKQLQTLPWPENDWAKALQPFTEATQATISPSTEVIRAALAPMLEAAKVWPDPKAFAIPTPAVAELSKAAQIAAEHGRVVSQSSEDTHE